MIKLWCFLQSASHYPFMLCKFIRDSYSSVHCSFLRYINYFITKTWLVSYYSPLDDPRLYVIYMSYVIWEISKPQSYYILITPSITQLTFFCFYLNSLSWTFLIHRGAGEGEVICLSPLYQIHVLQRHLKSWSITAESWPLLIASRLKSQEATKTRK